MQDTTLKEWKQLELEIAENSHVIEKLLSFLKTTIVGQEVLLERLLIGLLCNGHILLEGMPGLAKTLAVKTLAKSVNAEFSRIQFTPDILPADILGTTIFNIHSNEFTIKKGPVFANFLLADEINRAPEKVQSALLEVMQEHQVTIGTDTFKLDAPFMVLATQNPIDQAGTYELPEAQMDRFMMKVHITYPTREDERLINRNSAKHNITVESAIHSDSILRMQELVTKIFVDEKIEDYILDIILSTRNPENFNAPHLTSYIKYGSSPRGGINLTHAARAHAFLNKRSYVLPADVFAVAPDVLRHRIGLTYASIAQNITSDYVIQELLKAIPSP